MAESIDIVRAPGLAAFPHGFLGRTGGVSTGVAASLNVGLGAGDADAAVRENRRRAAAAIAGAELRHGLRAQTPRIDNFPV